MLLFVLDNCFFKIFKITSNISKLYHVIKFAFIKLCNIFIQKMEKRSKNYRKTIHKRSKTIQKRSKIYPKTVQNDPKTILKLSKNNPKTIQKDPKTF